MGVILFPLVGHLVRINNVFIEILKLRKCRIKKVESSEPQPTQVFEFGSDPFFG